LEAAPDREIQVAMTRYKRLQPEADADGRLKSRIDKERRAELTAFGEGKTARAMDTVLHNATFGLYTHRASKDDENLAVLDRNRRIQYQLSFLDSLVRAGTRPEVAYDSARIKASVDELSGLLHQVQVTAVRAHATATLQQLGKLSRDPELESDCSAAVAALERPAQPVRGASAPGLVASSVAATK
jgi:hypothetical protein